MNEKLNIKKSGKSKFGFYLLLEDGTFKGVSEAVSKFVGAKSPCTIEVTETGEKGIITRVKVVPKVEQNEMQDEMNEFEQPIEVVRPGEKPFRTADEYKENYWDWKKEKDIETQESIKAQFCVREAIRMTEVNNGVSPLEEKSKINATNILANARLIWNVLDTLTQPEVN